MATAEQQQLFPKRRARVDLHQRTEAENITAARIVLRNPDLYGPGLTRWARMILKTPEGENTQ